MKLDRIFEFFGAILIAVGAILIAGGVALFLAPTVIRLLS